MRISLPWRLFISYTMVIAVGAAVAYVMVRLLAPTFFDHQMNMLDGDPVGMGGGGRGGGGGPAAAGGWGGGAARGPRRGGGGLGRGGRAAPAAPAGRRPVGAVAG